MRETPQESYLKQRIADLERQRRPTATQHAEATHLRGELAWRQAARERRRQRNW